MADPTIDPHSEIPALANRLTPESIAAIEAAAPPRPHPPDGGLKEPVRSFDETFSGESVVMAHFFPSAAVAPQNERAKLAEQLERAPQSWLPGVGDVVNIAFDLAQRDLIVAALRANR